MNLCKGQSNNSCTWISSCKSGPPFTIHTGKMKVWSTWLAWSTQSRIKNLPWYFVILKNKGWEKWQCCTFLPLNSSLAAKSEAAPLLSCMFGQHWAKDKVLPLKQWPPNVFPYPSFFCSIQEINFIFHSIYEVWYQDLSMIFFPTPYCSTWNIITETIHTVLITL